MGLQASATRPGIFVFLVETGFYQIGQVGLELLTSGDPPASASQSAGIAGVSHCALPGLRVLRPANQTGLLGGHQLLNATIALGPLEAFELRKALFLYRKRKVGLEVAQQVGPSSGLEVSGLGPVGEWNEKMPV